MTGDNPDELLEEIDNMVGSEAPSEYRVAPSSGQVGGDHYLTMGAFQPWAVLAAWMSDEELRGFAKGTAIVYLARENLKGGDEDIAKAIHTLELYQEYRR